ncbi:unnamed protein product, partial [Adineta steineri]
TDAPQSGTEPVPNGNK